MQAVDETRTVFVELKGTCVGEPDCPQEYMDAFCESFPFVMNGRRYRLTTSDRENAGYVLQLYVDDCPDVMEILLGLDDSVIRDKLSPLEESGTYKVALWKRTEFWPLGKEWMADVLCWQYFGGPLDPQCRMASVFKTRPGAEYLQGCDADIDRVRDGGLWESTKRLVWNRGFAMKVMAFCLLFLRFVPSQLRTLAYGQFLGLMVIPLLPSRDYTPAEVLFSWLFYGCLFVYFYKRFRGWYKRRVSLWRVFASTLPAFGWFVVVAVIFIREWWRGGIRGTGRRMD